MSMPTATFEQSMTVIAAQSARDRLVLVEPQRLFRETLALTLGPALREAQIECYASVDAVRPGVARMALIALDPSGESDIAAQQAVIQELRELCDNAPVGIILHREDPALARALAAMGAAGIIEPGNSLAIVVAAVRLMLVGGSYLPREIARVASPLRSAPEDGPPRLAGSDLVEETAPRAHGLTSREHDVLRCLREGRQNKLIAYELGISESTVKVHLRSLMKKLHASNRTQAALGAPMRQ